MNTSRQGSGNNNLGKAKTEQCKECKGKGYVRVNRDGYPFIQKCSCQKQSAFHQVLVDSGIPPKYWNSTLNEKIVGGRTPYDLHGGVKDSSKNLKMIASKSQTKALNICKLLKESYIDFFKHNKTDKEVFGLLLWGKPGRGKTRLVCSLLRDLIAEGIHSVKFVEYNQLFKMIRHSFTPDGPNYQQVLKPILNAKVVVIDDLGTHVTGSTVFLLDQMGYLINERYNRNLPTIFTCNDWISASDMEQGDYQKNDTPDLAYNNAPSWKQKKVFEDADKKAKMKKEIEEVETILKQRVSERLRSRIREMCIEHELEGFDYRRKIGNKHMMQLKMTSRQRNLEIE